MFCSGEIAIDGQQQFTMWSSGGQCWLSDKNDLHPVCTPLIKDREHLEHRAPEATPLSDQQDIVGVVGGVYRSGYHACFVVQLHLTPSRLMAV